MVTQKFPLTYQELTELAGDQLIRFSATFDEYWKLLEKAEFNADFYDNEIIAMSYENELHSYIVTRLSFLLNTIFFTKTQDYKVHNSNRPIYVKDCGKHTVFNPDGSVIQQPPVHFEYSPRVNAETTPSLIFEVLSKSTRAHDFGTKLPCYKQIPTLQTIVYLETTKPSLLLMERKSKNQWTETAYTELSDTITIDNQHINIEDIYSGVTFE